MTEKRGEFEFHNVSDCLSSTDGERAGAGRKEGTIASRRRDSGTGRADAARAHCTNPHSAARTEAPDTLCRNAPLTTPQRHLPARRLLRAPFERMGDSPRLERRGSSSPPALPPDWGPLEPLLFDGPSHGRAARTNEQVPPCGDRRAATDAQPERQYSAGNRYFQRRGLVKAVQPPLIDVVEFSLKHLGGRACRMTKRMLLQARPSPSPSPNPNPTPDPTPATSANPKQEINTHMTHRHDDNAAAVAQLGAMPPLTLTLIHPTPKPNPIP